MGETTDDGGPAFPRDHAHDGHNGMSLRDYFAAAAPAAEIDNMVPATVAEAAAYIGVPAEEYRYTTHYALVAAKARYAYADAMLQARKETP